MIELTIINELGLHARAAAKISQVARDAKSTIWIYKGEEKADASSVIDILTLACSSGTKIKLSANDSSDQDILDKIIALVEDGFGEMNQ